MEALVAKEVDPMPGPEQGEGLAYSNCCLALRFLLLGQHYYSIAAIGRLQAIR